MTQSRPEVIFVKNGKGRGKRLGESAFWRAQARPKNIGVEQDFHFRWRERRAEIIGWLLAEKIWPRWCHFREG